MIRSTVLLHAHITAASRILLPLLPAHSTRSRTKVSYLQAGRQAHSSMQPLGVIFLFMFLFWFRDGGRPVIFPS